MEMAAQGWRGPWGKKFGYPRQVKARDASESHFDALPSIYISQIAFKKSAILRD